MIPMIVFVGPNGGLSWDNTQTMMRNNWSAICNLMGTHGVAIATFAGQRTFESNFNFDAFKCEGQCGGRVLPLDCAQMDHRIPQATLLSNFAHRLGSFTQTLVGNQYQGAFVPTTGALGRDSMTSIWKVCDQGTIQIIPHQGPSVITANYVYTPLNRTVLVTFPQATGLNAQTVAYDLIELMRNDITNVRPLCPPCNGARNGNPHLY